MLGLYRRDGEEGSRRPVSEGTALPAAGSTRQLVNRTQPHLPAREPRPARPASSRRPVPSPTSLSERRLTGLEWIGDVFGCRFVRGVQAMRVGGQPVHHRVPLLRAPPAAARPQAAARARPRSGSRTGTVAGTLARTTAPRRDRRHPRRVAAVRHDRAGGSQLRGVDPDQRRLPRASTICSCSARCRATGGGSSPPSSPTRAKYTLAYMLLRGYGGGDLRLAARAPPRPRSWCSARSLAPAPPGLWRPRGLPVADRRRRQRRRAGAARGVGRPRPARPPAPALLRRRPARHRDDRGGAAGDALGPWEASWLAGVIGAAVGLVLGSVSAALDAGAA